MKALAALLQNYSFFWRVLNKIITFSKLNISEKNWQEEYFDITNRSTLLVEIFAGTNFRGYKFSRMQKPQINFRGYKFSQMTKKENFRGIDFREWLLGCDFVGLIFTNDPQTREIRENFYPQKFLPIKYIKNWQIWKNFQRKNYILGNVFERNSRSGHAIINLYDVVEVYETFRAIFGAWIQWNQL